MDGFNVIGERIRTTESVVTSAMEARPSWVYVLEMIADMTQEAGFMTEWFFLVVALLQTTSKISSFDKPGMVVNDVAT